MRSQELTERFGIDAMDSEKEDILCYHHPSFTFNRDTYQMSPLLFESDTEDTSQSTEIKCYQEKTITPQEATPTLQDFRNETSSQLDTSSPHNQCCSETLLNSSHQRTVIDVKANTNHDYVSPSPRVTRLKSLNARILTRSAKRLHKISEFSEYSESPRNSRMSKVKKVSRRAASSSSNGKDSKCQAHADEKKEQLLMESIRMSNVRVVVERLKFPFFQNPHQIATKFVQPNIVPYIDVAGPDNDLDFLNHRLSSEVQMFTERPVVISLSSESTVRNASTSPRASPDLFENFNSSPVSNLCSQSSFDMPNGQRLMPDAERRMSETATSTPNSLRGSAPIPSIHDSFGCATPDGNVGLENLWAEDDRKAQQQQHSFEITVNEVFDHVIHVVDSDETIVPPPVDSKPQKINTTDNFVNLVDLTKWASSQEVTPKKRPEMHGLLNKSLGACPSTASPTLNRSKWLSKPKSSNSDGDVSLRTPQRCRRLELWFRNDPVSKPRKAGNVNGKMNLLLSSSEEEDS